MPYAIMKYIPLYVGAQIQYPDTDGRILRHKVTGYSIEDETIETTYKRKDHRGTKGDIIGADNGAHPCHIGNVVLLLKPIHDMPVSLYQRYVNIRRRDFNEIVETINDFRRLGFDCDNLIDKGLAKNSNTRKPTRKWKGQ